MAPRKKIAPAEVELNPASPLMKAHAEAMKVIEEDPIVQIDVSTLRETLPHISTGSIVLNYLIGGRVNAYGVPPCPGFPRGRISNLYGNAGAGKTTTALQAAAEVCKAGGTCLYLDWEHEVVPSYARALGVPIERKDKFMLAQPDTLEDGLIMLVTYASAGVDLIIIDSVGAAKPKAIENRDLKEMGENIRMGLVASKWSDFLPTLKKVIAKTNTCIVAISQLRATMNAKGSDSDAQGGNAWKFYSSVRLKLAMIKKETTKVYNPITGGKDDQVTGTIVKARLDKCKVSDAAYHEQILYLTQGKGFDNTRTVIEIAVAHKIIKKAGAWVKWMMPSGEELAGQGMDKFQKMLHAKEGALNTLYEITIPKILASGPTEETESEVETKEVDDDIAALMDVINGKGPSEPKDASSESSDESEE